MGLQTTVDWASEIIFILKYKNFTAIVCTHVYIYMCVYMCIYTCMCIHVCVYIHMCVHMYTMA